MRPQRETALGLRAALTPLRVLVGRGLCLGPMLLFPHCSLQEDDDRERTTAGSWWAQAWALGPCTRNHSVGLTHTWSVVHTTHASTHPILLSGQRLARSHTHSPSASHIVTE